MNTLSEANGNFAIHLLKMLCESNPSKNVCYSPVSISSALAMVLLGAKGDTAVQMSQALGLNTDKDIHQGFQRLLSNLNKPNRKYLLRTANRLFAESSCEFLPTFKESCLHFYHSELEQLSFAKAAEESRKHINTWVSEQTEGKIPELLSGDSVDSKTRLVLVNALYFKGKWQKEFDKERTREMPFKINQREKRPVQMMYQKGVFKLAYVKEVQATMLVMPYDGMELSLMVLLPVDGVDLSKVENNLTFEKLMSWTKPDFMWSTRAEVLLPKFKLQENYDMKSVFQHLGMVDVFQGGKADLSGMSLERNLCVSECVHKSVVEVNEEGTEAAASTMVNVCCFSSGGDPRFCADHPFPFLHQAQ
ncbi:serpin B9-like [Peromyscus californicus insignis]|uniref:serpin B9-like n=1 Tax=Peromyscus californicus insignis TaxID=564181 RepID=UPI0022A7E12C|nr:serpin B9-like [Peromyscus californicus insignis]